MVNTMQTILVLVALITAAQCFRSKVPPAVNGNYPGRLRGGRNVVAVFDMGGVNGTIQFYQQRPGDPTFIHVNLDGLDQYQDTYPWHIHQFPVRFGTLRDYPCTAEEIGGHYDPLGAFAEAEELELVYNEVCANNATRCEVGDLSGRHGRLRNDQPWQKFEDENLDLFGPYSPIGHSILVHRGDADGEPFICANVEYNGVRVDTLRAAIENGPLQGDVIIRRVEGIGDATIEVDIYRNDGLAGTTHSWSLNLGQPDEARGCGAISNDIYGAQTHAGDESLFDGCGAGPNRQLQCAMGDLTQKCGPLVFDDDGRGRIFCTDSQLGTVPLSYLTPLSLVIRDSTSRVISCAPLLPFEPECSAARFQNRRLYGDVFFYQATPYDRTFVRSYVTGIRAQNPRFLIRENPVPANGSCVGLGDIIRKPGPLAFGVPITDGPTRTGDSVLLGNLDPKVPIPFNAQSLRAVSSSSYLPLFGPYNITGHSLSLETSMDMDNLPIWCATIERFNPVPEDLIASILGFQEEA